MEHLNFEQRSEDWHNARLGKITGSEFYLLAGTSKRREEYIYKKANEILTQSKQEIRINEDMQRGIDLEPHAIEEYENKNLCNVKQIGFVVLNDYAGCSPDGLVGDDGIIEVKCLRSYKYLKAVHKKYIESEHKWQMQYNLYVTNRNWCDYVLYCPDYEDIESISSLYQIRVYKDEKKQKEIEDILNKAIEEIKNIIN